MTTTHTIDDQLDIAGDMLAEHDITLIIYGGRQSAEDAWSDAAAEYGDRIALMRERRGPSDTHIVVSWHYNHPEIARAIVDAFTTAGAKATWDGEFWSAVHVDLATA
jgi:hypothetical protein